jgi:hypothetical protein
VPQKFPDRVVPCLPAEPPTVTPADGDNPIPLSESTILFADDNDLRLLHNNAVSGKVTVNFTIDKSQLPPLP